MPTATAKRPQPPPARTATEPLYVPLDFMMVRAPLLPIEAYQALSAPESTADGATSPPRLSTIYFRIQTSNLSGCRVQRGLLHTLTKRSVAASCPKGPFVNSHLTMLFTSHILAPPVEAGAESPTRRPGK
jgi:hypothetical protein